MPLHEVHWTAARKPLKKREPSLLEEKADQADMQGSVRHLTLGLSKEMQAGIIAQPCAPFDVHDLRVSYKSGLMPTLYPLYPDGAAQPASLGRRSALPALKKLQPNALASGRRILAELPKQPGPVRSVACY